MTSVNDQFCCTELQIQSAVADHHNILVFSMPVRCLLIAKMGFVSE